jgi:hypothetical protein
MITSIPTVRRGERGGERRGEMRVLKEHEEDVYISPPLAAK